MSENGEGRHRRGPVVPLWGVLAVVGLLAVGAVAGLLLAGGGDDDRPSAAATKTVDDAQTVTFQKPSDPGPKPFTEPAEREGRETVAVTPTQTAGGPFGGSGSNAVCDRDRLIRYLKANPERMRAWAQALGVNPTYRSVRRYIAKLHPVTLKHDTRVTNHTFEGGRAVAFQSILQAGTAVLVDDHGRPVVRCRCGNPLAEPVFIPTAKCYGCPPRYTPPTETCEYWKRTTTYTRRWTPDGEYTNTTYDEIFIRRSRRGPFDDCWTAYPEPPTVTIVDVYTGPRLPRTTTTAQTPPPAQTGTPRAYFTPASGTVGDTYTLHASGFPPNTPVTITLTRPDGAVERYSFTTNGAGSGSYTFARTGGNTVLGTYTAVVSGGGRSTTASTHVSAEPQQAPPPQAPPPPPPPPASDELQCHPPRSQLEFEQCVEQGVLGTDG
ncbi:MAG TPA: DUF6777 domain-containing protein [Solirubrobacteraceae bacterium]